MDNFKKEITTYEHDFRFADDHGTGFSFPCDKDGNIDSENMSNAAVNNYRLCLMGTHKGRKVDYIGIIPHTIIKHLCMCGSGKEKYPLHDARGIFCCYVCEDCEAEKKKGYRRDIFIDSDYETDEEV